MKETRKQLLQNYLETWHRYVRLIGSEVLCPQNCESIPKSQLILLYILLEHRQMTIKQLAEELHITSSAATQLVEHVVNLGLAERIETKDDRRQVNVRLTGEGVRETMQYKESALIRLEEVMSTVNDTKLSKIIEFQKEIVDNKESK